MANLPALLPTDPALASVIADEMAAMFAPSRQSHPSYTSQLANEDEECHADDPSTCRVHGAPKYKAATPEAVKTFLANPPDRMSPEDTESLLTAGFDDKDGAGNTVKYGTQLLDHIDTNGHSEKDILERKRRLGTVVKLIRGTSPIQSGDPKKPNERIYAGKSNGKAYIGVADEHGELKAMLMVSYRRDSRNDEK